MARHIRQYEQRFAFALAGNSLGDGAKNAPAHSSAARRTAPEHLPISGQKKKREADWPRAEIPYPGFGLLRQPQPNQAGDRLKRLLQFRGALCAGTTGHDQKCALRESRVIAIISVAAL